MHGGERTGLGHVWATAREYLTHWVIAGLILSLTGFVPEEWFAKLVETLALPERLQTLWPEGLDPRVVIFALGVAIIVTSVLLRHLAHREKPTSAQARSAANSSAFNAPRLSIVVLPIENPTGDKDQEYFADGITEDLTTDLSRISGAFVVATKTALTFKGKASDVKEIGRQLGVRYALEGSVRRVGNQIRVNAQLIDAETGAHLWADRFDGDVSDLPRLQNEVTARLARSLDAELVVVESSRARRDHPDNPDAVDLTLRGRAAFNKDGSPENLATARRFFEQALAIDQTAVGALVALAPVLARIVTSRVSPSPEKDAQLADDVATRALALKPDSAAGYYALGFARRIQNRHEESSAAFTEAIARDPNFAPAYAHLGQTKTWLGKSEETFELVQKAIRLSPRDPELGIWFGMIGIAHYWLGRNDDAIEWMRKAAVVAPGHAIVWQVLASAYARTGRLDEAHGALATLDKLVPRLSITKMRTENHSDNSVFLARRERFLEGLKLAGMPEN